MRRQRGCNPCVMGCWLLNRHGFTFFGPSALVNPLTPNPYFTKSLLCAEALGRAAAKRKKRFFPKITARLVFKIKSSFLSPFLVNGYILSCKCQKCKKIILSYIYVELCYSENEIFHIFTYITAAVRQTAKDTEFN